MDEKLPMNVDNVVVRKVLDPHVYFMRFLWRRQYKPLSRYLCITPITSKGILNGWGDNADLADWVST